MACLAFACYAAGGHPSLAGVTVAYAAARAVGSIPLMPGGLLVVEAVLVPGLVSSGMTLASAISAMLIYRLVSWIFISAIGWVVFFFMFRTEKDIDPDAADARATPTPSRGAAVTTAQSRSRRPHQPGTPRFDTPAIRHATAILGITCGDSSACSPAPSNAPTPTSDPVGESRRRWPRGGHTRVLARVIVAARSRCPPPTAAPIWPTSCC